MQSTKEHLKSQGWDRDKQNYFISRRGRNLWPILKAKEPHEFICSYPAYLYANMNQRDFTREICFATDDLEVKEIAIDAFEEAIKRMVPLHLIVKKGPSERREAAEIKYETRRKDLEEELNELVAERYREAK